MLLRRCKSDTLGMRMEMSFVALFAPGEASTGTPSPSSGNAGLPDIKATLDALDAASKQAMGGQQAEGKPPPVDGADPENSLIEAVMRKLLSKEILYDPLLVCSV